MSPNNRFLVLLAAVISLGMSPNPEGGVSLGSSAFSQDSDGGDGDGGDGDGGDGDGGDGDGGDGDGGDGDGGDGDGGDGDGGDGDGGDGDGGDGDGGDGDGGDGDGGDGDGGDGDGGDGDGGDGDGGDGDGGDGDGGDAGDNDGDRADADSDTDNDGLGGFGEVSGRGGAFGRAGGPDADDADETSVTTSEFFDDEVRGLPQTRARPDQDLDTEESLGIVDAIADLFGGDDDDNSGGDRDVLDDEIVALGLPAFSAADRDALEDAGFAVIAQDTLPGLGGEVLRLALPLGIRPEEGVQIASALVPGAIFDKNDLYGTNEGDCTGANCWAATAVGMARAPRPSCYRGSPIAIIDTAVDTGHPALRGTRITRRSFVPTGATASGSDHGTAIAAILVGDLGPDLPPLAPGARLLVAEAVQDIDGRALADTVAVIRGLDWAISSRSRVVAMSLAGGENRALERAIRTVAGRINIVAAAGNGGPRSAPVYPAAYPEVLAVSAVDRRLRPYRNGNRGGYIDIAAPGVGVVSAGGGATRAWSGTSFAVPYVAAALLRARALTNGDAAAAQALLLSSARDLGPPGPDEVYGHGLVQSPGDRCW